jgi:hypothetical protein
VECHILDKWSANWGTHILGGTRRHLRRYAKHFTGYVKLNTKQYFMINTEKSGLDLGLTTGDPVVTAFDLGA